MSVQEVFEDKIFSSVILHKKSVWSGLGPDERGEKGGQVMDVFHELCAEADVPIIWEPQRARAVGTWIDEDDQKSDAVTLAMVVGFARSAFETVGGNLPKELVKK